MSDRKFKPPSFTQLAMSYFIIAVFIWVYEAGDPCPTPRYSAMQKGEVCGDDVDRVGDAYVKAVVWIAYYPMKLSKYLRQP